MLSAKCELLDSLMFSNLLQERDIMNMKTWVAMLGLCLLGLLLLTGCNKKENTNEEQGTSPTSGSKPSQTSAPIDQSTAAKVSGTVTFGGAAPKPAKIDMSQDGEIAPSMFPATKSLSTRMAAVIIRTCSA